MINKKYIKFIWLERYNKDQMSDILRNAKSLSAVHLKKHSDTTCRAISAFWQWASDSWLVQNKMVKCLLLGPASCFDINGHPRVFGKSCTALIVFWICSISNHTRDACKTNGPSPAHQYGAHNKGLWGPRREM